MSPTYSNIEVVCGSCGEIFIHRVPDGLCSAESKDLDTRPSKMKQSAMRSWLQFCSNCGYCAYDASNFDERCRILLDSAYYRHELYRGETANPDNVTLSSMFKCAARLYQVCGNSAAAGWANLHVAWIHDDECDTILSQVRRSIAADFFLGILRDGKKFSSQVGMSEVIVIDILRRAGRFEEALKVIEKLNITVVPEATIKILDFERTLIGEQNISAHFLGHALDASGD